MALDLPYKLQIFSIIKSLLLIKKYQYVDMQFLTYQIILEPLLTNFNCLLQYIRKSIWKRYKLFLQIDDFIKEIITITITTVVTIVTDKDYIALYVIRKDVAYKNILRRSKKSLKPSLGPPIKISLVNSITNLRNNSINIL